MAVNIAKLGHGFERNTSKDYGYARHHHWIYESKLDSSYLLDRDEYARTVEIYYKCGLTKIEIYSVSISSYNTEQNNDRLRTLNSEFMDFYRSPFAKALADRQEALPMEIMELARKVYNHEKDIEKIDHYMGPERLCFDMYGYIFDEEGWKSFSNTKSDIERNEKEHTVYERQNFFNDACRYIGLMTDYSRFVNRDFLKVEDMSNRLSTDIPDEKKMEILKIANEYEEIRKESVKKFAELFDVKYKFC